MSCETSQIQALIFILKEQLLRLCKLRPALWEKQMSFSHLIVLWLISRMYLALCRCTIGTTRGMYFSDKTNYSFTLKPDTEMSLLLFNYYYFSACKFSSRIVCRPWSLWYTCGIITSIKNVMVSPYLLRKKSELYKIIWEKQQLLLLSRFCSSKIFSVVNVSCLWCPATSGEAEILLLYSI